MRWGLVLCAALGCGRLGFDALPASTDAGVDAFDPVTGPWAQVFSNGNSICAVKDDGSAFCAGSNEQSQLGTGVANFAIGPSQLQGSWRTLALGPVASCGLQLDGSLWCWGNDISGGIPDGTASGSVMTPLRIGVETDWVEVGVADRHGCARKQDNTLWCWGDNGSRQFDPILPTASNPIQVRANVRSFATFRLHTSVVDLDGSLWITGQTYDGEAGNGTLYGTYMTYTRIGTGTDWHTVAAGPDRTCTTKVDGTLWCSGRGMFGALGNGGESSTSTFVKVASGNTWVGVTMGVDHVCGSRQDGTAWCWGASTRGQFAVPIRSNVPTSLMEVKSIAAGDVHTCIVTTTGVLRCSGSNHFGQLRLPAATHPLPLQVAGPFARILSTYDSATCAKDGDGATWCWGENDAGQLGTGGIEWHQKPVALPGNWTEVSVGSTISVGIQAGSLYWWGTNRATLAFQGTPAVLLSAQTDFTQVATGAFHACALRANGDVYCWGENSQGQLGVGDIAGRGAPALVGTGFSMIAAGREHTCGVQNGVLVCWGDNFYGTVGDNTNIDRLVPTAVSCSACGARVIDKLAVGDGFSNALMTDGTVFAWGLGSSGQLGTGVLAGSPVAVQAAMQRVWRAIETGDTHSCAIDDGGRMWCWGHGDEGQLGDGTFDQAATSPRAVGTDTDWVSVEVGAHYSCGLKPGGTRYCWGQNHSGTYADGLSWSDNFIALAMGQ